ncbi:hypothetical protein ABBQ32_013077 [Trebouxia sp. C0010 RCD-2024]
MWSLSTALEKPSHRLVPMSVHATHFNQSTISPTATEAHCLALAHTKGPGDKHGLTQSETKCPNLVRSSGAFLLSLSQECGCSFSKQVQRPQEGKGRLPGPGQYRMKGGDQALSTHLASSSVCFPLAPRNQADKVYSGAASETAFLGKESPGPMAYDQHHSGIGRQALSARSNAPECHIGQADRFKQSRGGDAGTGLFKLQGSLGLQGVSTKPSLPAYSLGASTRDQMYKAFLTRRHEKTGVLGGLTGPGPNTAVPQSSLGPQKTSLHLSGSRWSFSHSSRMGNSSSEGTPGPGAYCC